MAWALAHGQVGGIWEHAPPETFENLDTLIMFLMHSDTSFSDYF